MVRKSNGDALRSMWAVWKQRRKRVRVIKYSFWVAMVRVGIMSQRQSTAPRLGMYVSLILLCCEDPLWKRSTADMNNKCYYSALDGYDGITWADAKLTSTGQDQALAVNKLWAEQLPLGIPPPQTYYVSPLTRTIETANLTFKSLPLPPSHAYKPFIKELVREALGVHTCDRRSTAEHLKQTFTDPPLTFESGFSNKDLLWEAEYREPDSARRYRLATFLDDVFASDDNVWLSFTSHSGAIGSMLEVLGHRMFALETGGVIPVFVKAERVQGKREVPPKEPSAAPPLCDGPPE